MVLLVVVLSAAPQDGTVIFDYSDFLDGERPDIDLLRTTLGEQLLRRQALADLAIECFSGCDSSFAWERRQAQLNTLWLCVNSATDAVQKGSLLEQFAKEVFQECPGMSIVSQDVRLGDMEIDVILKNDVSSSFWTGMASPLMMVECKNWSTCVEAKHVRDFRAKVQDHRATCQVGWMISPQGFTSGCIEEAKRSGNNGSTIVLINGQDVARLLASSRSVKDWLESAYSKSAMV